MAVIRGKFLVNDKPAATWASDNPTLRSGEQGYESDTRKMKIGDGVTAWNDLDYLVGDGGGGGGGGTWGSITGVLSSQVDLQAALDAKQVAGSYLIAADLAPYALTAAVNAALADKYDVSNPANYITSAALAGYATTAAVAAGYQPLAAVLTGTTASFTTALETKLNGIATGATANSSDAFLLARGNHTGTQLAATISDFNAAADARVSAGLVGYITSAAVAAGYQPLDSDLTTIAGLTATTDNFIVSVASAWASRTPAQVRTTLNVANGATANDTDANLRDRSTHTGTQTAATISDFSEAVDDRVGALLVAGTNMTVTYNDGAGTITLDAATGGSGDNQTAVNGTVSLPSFAFTSDPDTGMYRYGANELGFALGGALALRLSSFGASFQAAAATPCDFFVTSGTGAYTGSLSFSRNGGADTVATVESDADATTRRGLIYKAFTVDGKHRLQVNGTDRLEANNTGIIVTGTLAASGAVSGSNLSGTNTGDQTSIVGITGTLAQFNTAVTDADLAPIASPTFTGNPAAPTQAVGDNSTKLATTAYARAASPLRSYRTILDCSASHTAARVAGTYWLPQGEAAGITGTGTLYPPNLIYIDSTDYPTVDGLAAKLRVRAVLAVNDVAPTGNYTFGLYPVTTPIVAGGAGVRIYTMGTVVTGSTVAVNTPAADSLNTLDSADFALPANGFYVLGFVSTTNVAASSHLHISALLQLRNN